MIHIENKNKIDGVVLKETQYIGAWALIFSTVMQAVFLVIGKWDYTVLLGNVLGVAAAVFNFLFMGITIQKSLGKEEKDAAQAMRASQSLRMFMLLVVALIGFLVPVFSAWTTIIPFFFPRIAIMIRPFLDKRKGGK